MERVSIACGSGANLVVIDDPYYDGDVWVQDQIPFGFTSYHEGSSLPVVFNSPRDREDFGPNHGLRDFAEREPRGYHHAVP